MVKITEDWMIVEGGTKLYTKAWEVSRSSISTIQMSITPPSFGFVAAKYFMEVHRLNSLF
jgi:hypothetical protein